MRHLLENQKTYGFDDELVQYTAGTLFEAGSDTTTSLTTSLILAATNNNEFWQKAKEEVDRVVGPDRMPTARRKREGRRKGRADRVSSFIY
jgi:cytochrome P450